MADPSFLMQLFPVFLAIIRESGLDLQQLIQFAAMFGGGAPPAPTVPPDPAMRVPPRITANTLTFRAQSA